MSIGSMGIGLAITRGVASAGDEGGGGEAPEWLPEVPAESVIVGGSFKNGTYWDGTTETANPAALFEDWEGNLVVFDAAQITGGTGYVSSAAEYFGGSLKAGLVSQLDAASLSVLVHCKRTTDDLNPMFAGLASPDFGVYIYVDSQLAVPIETLELQTNYHTLQLAEAPPATNTPFKFAARFEPTEGNIASNGVAAEGVENIYDPMPVSLFWFMMNNAVGMVIEEVYFISPALSDAEMEALTAA